MRKLIKTVAAAGLFLGLGATGTLAAEGVVLPKQSWSFDGVFGSFDRASLQRGLQVYKEVCASCHGAKLLYYRNIEDMGYTPEEARAFAANFEVTAGPNDQGEMFQRPALPSDHFVSPFPNEQAARVANGGALPPDLSLMAKARPNGPDYIHALMTGYGEPSAHFKEEYEKLHNAPFELADGQHFNAYFAGNKIGMPQPLYEDGVTFADGTKATIAQQAHDVATFLMWAAEPKLENRKSTGIGVILFLVVFTGLALALKRRTWAAIH